MNPCVPTKRLAILLQLSGRRSYRIQRVNVASSGVSAIIYECSQVWLLQIKQSRAYNMQALIIDNSWDKKEGRGRDRRGHLRRFCPILAPQILQSSLSQRKTREDEPIAFLGRPSCSILFYRQRARLYWWPGRKLSTSKVMLIDAEAVHRPRIDLPSASGEQFCLLTACGILPVISFT